MPASRRVLWAQIRATFPPPSWLSWLGLYPPPSPHPLHRSLLTAPHHHHALNPHLMRPTSALLRRVVQSMLDHADKGGNGDGRLHADEEAAEQRRTTCLATMSEHLPPQSPHIDTSRHVTQAPHVRRPVAGTKSLFLASLPRRSFSSGPFSGFGFAECKKKTHI